MNEKELQAMIESQLAQGIQRRQEDADLLRMLAQKQVEQPTQTDLSGFFDMAEIAGASPRAGARYAAPKGQSPLAAIQPVMKAEGEISDDQINYLKTKLAGAQADKAAGTQWRFMAAKSSDWYKQLKNDVQKVEGEYNELDRTAKQVEDAIKPNEKGEIELERLGQVTALFGRMLGNVGAQTENDAKRVVYEDLARKMDTVAGLVSKGDFKADESFVKNIKATLDASRAAVADITKERLNTVNDAYSNEADPIINQMWSRGGGKTFYEKTSERLNKRLSPKEVVTETVSSSVQAPAIDMAAKAKAEMERRKAGK